MSLLEKLKENYHNKKQDRFNMHVKNITNILEYASFHRRVSFTFELNRDDDSIDLVVEYFKKQKLIVNKKNITACIVEIKISGWDVNSD